MSMKEKKVTKTEKREAKGNHTTVLLTKGYSYQLTTDKDGKPLETPSIRYCAVDSYFEDEDGNQYYQRKSGDSIIYKKCKIIDVCVITTTKKDGGVITKVVAVPTYLRTVSEATLLDFVHFREL